MPVSGNSRGWLEYKRAWQREPSAKLMTMFAALPVVTGSNVIFRETWPRSTQSAGWKHRRSDKTVVLCVFYYCKGNSVVRVSACWRFWCSSNSSGFVRANQTHIHAGTHPLRGSPSFPSVFSSRYDSFQIHTQSFHWCKWEEGGTVELMNLSLTGSSSVISLWKTDNITSTKILVKCQHVIRFHSHAISITHKFIN